MNKKFTFMVAALLAAGSFSANAEKINGFLGTDAAKVEGKYYFLEVGTDKYLGAQLNDDEDAIEYSILAKDQNDENLTKETLKKYLWTISENKASGQVYEYKFTNALTGKTLSFEYKDSKFRLVTELKPSEDAEIESNFRILADTETDIDAGSKYAKTSKFTLAGYDNDDALVVESEPTVTVDETGDATEITLVNIADGINVDVEDLNDLYNSAGFNFTLNDDKLANVGNIFADKRVVALNVATKTVGDKTFPAGTYFATSVPYLWDYTKGNPSYDYLVQCTFIAVDSDNNILDDDAEGMKAGKGFTLTEVSGKDLVLYNGKEDKFKAQGNQIAVCNAVFTVKESTTADVYKLTVANVRALEKAGDSKQKDSQNLDIVASKGDAQIATGASSSSANFIFKFAESTVEKGISFLKTDGAAIYNIKFYKKNGTDESYNAKYLTMNPLGNEFIAKGEVLADLDAPAYQWLITKVDGSNVTFLNRETGATLETQLFKEEGGKYSLSPKSAYTSDSKTINQTFTYYNVNKDGDVVYGKDANNYVDVVNFQNVQIELKESKAVNFSDYLNVEDGTVMTLSFGRDIAPTSNKLYPAVKQVGVNDYVFCDNTDKHYYLTDDINSAAQWLLVKSVNNTHAIKYNYAYANGDLVNIKNNGDVVYAYTYKLQLVLDGKAIENQYLTQDVLSSANSKMSYHIGEGTEFYIQENEDGSVLLKTSRNSSAAMLLHNYDDETLTIGDLVAEGFKYQTIFVTSEADDVKTYLIAEAPAVSLPGNEGHYSIATELGNYITMNEERDGLTVKEETDPLYLYVTDQKAVVPSFYVTKAAANKAERMFLFNPTDSVDYYVAEGQYNKKYQLSETGNPTKVIFKAASINETRDTLKTNIKGEMATVAMKANNTNKVVGGLDKFKVQIIESADADGLYNIRQNGAYVTVINGKMAWAGKGMAQKFEITGAEAPTSNESVAASEVKVIANNGSINVKNAAGKNVVVSTILGQVVANEVLTSDNATINVPAGIVVVAVDGESFKVNVK